MVIQFLIPILIQLAVAVILMAISYAIAPKPKSPKPQIQDLQLPTADVNRPVPVVFGTINIKGPNVLWHGEKTTVVLKVG